MRIISFSLLLSLVIASHHAQTQTLVPKVEAGPTTKALQASLYELIDQNHAVQQAHWNATGPMFYDLHELTGEFYQELAALIDVVAERKGALGVAPDGRPAEAAQIANLMPFPEGYLEAQQAIDILANRYAEISNRLTDRVDTTGKTDMVSQDLLIDLKSTIEMHLWKLRMLKK